MMTRQVLFIASPHFQKSLERDACLIVDQKSVSRSQSARNIGVTFDDEMLLKQHISTVCQTAFFHLRSIGQIRRYLTEDACTTLVHSLVSTRIDYCNSLLVNLPARMMILVSRTMFLGSRNQMALFILCCIWPCLISGLWKGWNGSLSCLPIAGMS